MSIDRSQSVQSSTDCSTDPESPPPQNLHSTNEISTNTEESQDLQRVYSQISNVGQQTDNSPAINTPELSGETVPFTSDQIQQSDVLVVETFQLGTTNVDQESSRSIDLIIQNEEVTTCPKDLSVKSKTGGKRSKEKWHAMQYHIDFEITPEIPDNLNIPHGLADFNYHGEQIPIHIKQLCNVNKISHGEFGHVFSIVIKGSADIPIAVKIIPSGKIKVSEVTIMQEVCAAEHSHIVDYYCALIDPVNLSLYICMEFMDASIDAFYKIMHEQHNLEFDKLEQLLRRIVHDIASGLSYMERKEIIHRDIKPANLLINKHAVVKICDFGISRSFTRLSMYFNDLNDADYCQLSPLLHTENYMPPRIKGVIQDDMWSLGITLFEVVIGRNPFADWRSGGRYDQLMHWKPCIPPMISDYMQQLILHLLEKETCDRPPSYDYILNMPFISNVLDSPSTDECVFVRSIIEKISQIGNPD